MCVCACMHALVCACVCAYACVFEPVNCEVQGQRNTTSHRRDGGQNFVNQDYNIQPQEVKSSVRGSPPPLTPTVHPSHLPPGGCCPNTTPPPPPASLATPSPCFPLHAPFPPLPSHLALSRSTWRIEEMSREGTQPSLRKQWGGSHPLVGWKQTLGGELALGMRGG